MKFLSALVALCFLSLCAFAGERSYTCNVGPCVHRGGEFQHAPIAVQNGLVTTYDDTTLDMAWEDHCYPIEVPVWRGPNDDGVNMGALTAVRTTISLNPIVEWGCENTSNEQCGFAEYDCGAFLYFSQTPFYWHNPWTDGPYTQGQIWGGNSVWYNPAADNMAPFDGAVDGFGTSGRYGVRVGVPPPQAVSTPPGIEYYPGQWVRPWTVPNAPSGKHRFYFSPRAALSSSGMPSHWRGWNEYAMRASSTVTVTFVWQ